MRQVSHDGNGRQSAGLLQFGIPPRGGFEAACTGAGQVATGAAGGGIHCDHVAKGGAGAVFESVATGADGQVDG